MKDIIFIAGLPHSGTTILDLFIGSHPDCIGFGEVHFSTKKDVRWTNCSCGNHWRKCEIWKDIITGCPKDPDKKYLYVIKRLIQKFPQQHLVDSSKYQHPLSLLAEEFPENLKIIFICKDVRNWVNSMLRINRRKNMNLTVQELYKSWENGNKELLSFFRRKNLTYTRIGYEEFCLHTDPIKEKLCGFLGLNPDVEWELNPKSHVLFGNRMRVYKEKRENLIYDHQWFHNIEVTRNFTSAHNELNQRFVYSNVPPKY